MEDHGEYSAPAEQEAPRGNQLQRRGFSGMEIARQSAATDALIAKERASVEARWIMAMRQPRNMDDVRQMIMKECRRPGFADAAVYEVPRGDTKIVGLSIRFAEVAVRCMGNLQPETVTIYDDTESRIVRCTVTDYESNVTWSKDITIRKTVERKFLKKGQRPISERINSYGDRVYIVEASDDDVATKEAAQVSKSLRTLILRCIPGHIQDEALALCNAVYADKAKKDPDAARVAMLDAFAGVAVMPSDLEQLLGHTTERMNPAELERLRKIYAAISQGETTWAEVLEQTADARKAAATAATTTSAPAAQGATNAQPAPASNTTAAAPAASKATRSSKGTAALKDKLTEQPPAQPAPDKEPTAFDKAAADARVRDIARKLEEQKQADPEAEPGWMSGKSENGGDIGSASGEHGGSPDLEERACAGCGVPIDVVKGDPPGAKCYACRNS
jgi:hypothetical protein